MQKDQMLVVHLPQNSKYDAFKNGLKSMPSLDHVSVNSMELFQNSGGRFFVNNPFDKTKSLGFAFMNIDKEFLQNMKIDWLIKPRDMNQIGTDKTTIINEAAATELGKKPKDMLDIQLGLGNMSLKVIGVVKNFHYMSVHSPVEPMSIMVANEKDLSLLENDINFYVKINAKKDVQAQITAIGSLHKKLMPNETFSYYFLDQAFSKLYQSEERLTKMFSVFTLLALFISCLGLFGLATFSAQRRTKEIGIRKVLGASILQVSTLLSKEFLKLVILAIVLACPLGWWLMNTWLKDFPYKTAISWEIYSLAGVLTLSIAIGTVVYQSIKSAMMNPVQSLKTE
jgi:putative ABC transport system permease protein